MARGHKLVAAPCHTGPAHAKDRRAETRPRDAVQRIGDRVGTLANRHEFIAVPTGIIGLTRKNRRANPRPGNAVGRIGQRIGTAPAGHPACPAPTGAETLRTKDGGTEAGIGDSVVTVRKRIVVCTARSACNPPTLCSLAEGVGLRRIGGEVQIGLDVTGPNEGVGQIVDSDFLQGWSRARYGDRLRRGRGRCRIYQIEEDVR